MLWKLHTTQQWLVRTFCYPHRPPHSRPPHLHRPPPHQPSYRPHSSPPHHQHSYHHYSRRQEVLAGTERWIRLHDLIIKGELAPDVSSNDMHNYFTSYMTERVHAQGPKCASIHI